MNKTTPAGMELYQAICGSAIDGTAENVKHIVDNQCTLSLRHAYRLLRRNCEAWGFIRISRGPYRPSIIKIKRGSND